MKTDYEGFVDIQMTSNHSFFDCHLLRLDKEISAWSEQVITEGSVATEGEISSELLNRSLTDGASEG